MNIQQFDDNEIINTILGPLMVRGMVKKLDSWETDTEVGCSREFYVGDLLVRRDVSIQLKTPVEAKGRAAQIMGGLSSLGKRAVRGVRGWF